MCSIFVVDSATGLQSPDADFSVVQKNGDLLFKALELDATAKADRNSSKPCRDYHDEEVQKLRDQLRDIDIEGYPNMGELRVPAERSFDTILAHIRA